MALPSLRFLVFQGKNCPVCHAQDKQQVVEKFIDKHASAAKIVRLVCAAEEEDMKDEKMKKNYELSDDYGVDQFPTVILEARLPDGTGLELSRTVGGATMKQFNETFKTALNAIEDQFVGDEGTRSQVEASKEIAWG